MDFLKIMYIGVWWWVTLYILKQLYFVYQKYSAWNLDMKEQFGPGVFNSSPCEPLSQWAFSYQYVEWECIKYLNTICWVREQLQREHTHMKTAKQAVWPVKWSKRFPSHTLAVCREPRHRLGSSGQTSLVIVVEQEGVCQGLDPGSCWPTSHLVSVAANPREFSQLEPLLSCLARFMPEWSENAKHTHKKKISFGCCCGMHHRQA